MVPYSPSKQEEVPIPFAVKEPAGVNTINECIFTDEQTECTSERVEELIACTSNGADVIENSAEHTADNVSLILKLIQNQAY